MHYYVCLRDREPFREFIMKALPMLIKLNKLWTFHCSWIFSYEGSFALSCERRFTTFNEYVCAFFSNGSDGLVTTRKNFEWKTRRKVVDFDDGVVVVTIIIIVNIVDNTKRPASSLPSYKYHDHHHHHERKGTFMFSMELCGKLWCQKGALPKFVQIVSYK